MISVAMRISGISNLNISRIFRISATRYRVPSYPVHGQTRTEPGGEGKRRRGLFHCMSKDRAMEGALQVSSFQAVPCRFSEGEPPKEGGQGFVSGVTPYAERSMTCRRISTAPQRQIGNPFINYLGGSGMVPLAPRVRQYRQAPTHPGRSARTETVPSCE
jgi:hypothetical protein